MQLKWQDQSYNNILQSDQEMVYLTHCPEDVRLDSYQGTCYEPLPRFMLLTLNTTDLHFKKVEVCSSNQLVCVWTMYIQHHLFQIEFMSFT